MEEYTPMQEILIWNARRYPRWQAQDIYKLIFQAALGCEHAVTDRKLAQVFLEKELLRVMKQPATAYYEPLIDPIHPDEEIVRIHLRPLLRMQLSPVALLDSFLQTGAEYQGSLGQLEEYAVQALHLAQAGELNCDAGEVETLFMKMKKNNFPASHHSKLYKQDYDPAYRVVANRYLPSNWRMLSCTWVEQ